MDKNKQKRIKRSIRRGRVRSRVNGTGEKPRVSIFRSGQHIYAQIIDDAKGQTLVAVSSLKSTAKGKKSDTAKQVGLMLAQAAKAKKISEVVFDRGGYKYHGRVKALADGAREGGLKF